MATAKVKLADVGLLVLRLAGLGMAVHGWPKIVSGLEAGPEGWKFATGVAALGFPAPLFFAWAAAITELVGAALVTLGVYTRISSFLLAITMFVAAFIRHAADPFSAKEKALLYLVVFLGLTFLGGGKLTVDSFWRKR